MPCQKTRMKTTWSKWKRRQTDHRRSLCVILKLDVCSPSSDILSFDEWQQQEKQASWCKDIANISREDDESGESESAQCAATATTAELQQQDEVQPGWSKQVITSQGKRHYTSFEDEKDVEERKGTGQDNRARRLLLKILLTDKKENSSDEQRSLLIADVHYQISLFFTATVTGARNKSLKNALILKHKFSAVVTTVGGHVPSVCCNISCWT